MPIASQTRRLGEAEKNLKGARECIARHFVAFATKECKWQRLTSNLRTQMRIFFYCCCSFLPNWSLLAKVTNSLKQRRVNKWLKKNKEQYLKIL